MQTNGHVDSDDEEVDESRSKRFCKENVNKSKINGYSTSANLDRNSIVASEMGHLCFDAIYSRLYNHKLPINQYYPNITTESYPLFVTWKIGLEKRLRGCIGTFNPMPLRQGLQQYAVLSAFNDSRFEPISKRELSQLYVSVSVLLNFEQGSDYLDWTIGLHGIQIQFRTDSGSKRSATFLPQVAEEQEWTKEETIDALVRKAEFRGPITDKVRNSIRLTRYTCEKVTVSYKEYAEFRKSRSDWKKEDIPGVSSHIHTHTLFSTF